MTTPLPNNPNIDPDWYAREMVGLKVKLSAEFPATPEEEIDGALDLATRRLAVPAKIPNYLPVLVGREARSQLSARAAA